MSITELRHDHSLAIVTKIASKLNRSIDTDLSRRLNSILNKGITKELLTVDIDPNDYESAWDFSLDYQAVSTLRKLDITIEGVDRDKKSLETFLGCEYKNKLTNNQLTLISLGLEKPAREIFYLAKHKMREILRGYTDDWMSNFAFGPGATGSCRGSSVSVPNKMSEKLTVSFEAVPYAQRYYSRLPHLFAARENIFVEGPFSAVRQVFDICNFNELSFVPKNWKTKRAICIEPHGMIPMQKALGSYLRSRLLLSGIDLNNQASVNRRLARVGSIDGSYATIDLSNASDSISFMLVARLLDDDWMNVFASLRSPYTKMPDGTLIENEKFSSMGNGFTFELETMIFLCFCRAVKQYYNHTGEISVFGDDIVVPTSMAHQLIDILQQVGFEINTEKTFLTGPFRESCGFDYFKGTNVRPFFIRELPQYETDLYKTANALRHWCHRLGDYNGCASIGKHTWSYIVKTIRAENRFNGPSYLGDQVLWCPRSENRSNLSMLYGTTRITTVQPKVRRINLSSFSGPCILATALYGSGSNLALRGSTGRRIKRNHQIPFWDDESSNWI